MTVWGDVSPNKSLVFTAIKSEYLRHFRPCEQIFPETNRWVPLFGRRFRLNQSGLCTLLNNDELWNIKWRPIGCNTLVITTTLILGLYWEPKYNLNILKPKRNYKVSPWYITCCFAVWNSQEVPRLLKKFNSQFQGFLLFTLLDLIHVQNENFEDQPDSSSKSSSPRTA